MSEDKDDRINEGVKDILQTIVTRMMKEHPLFTATPMTFTAFGRGYVTAQMTLPEEFADGEAFHGGIFSILLDTLLAGAAWTRMEAFEPVATINLKTDFFEPLPTEERLELSARCAAIANQVAFCQGTVTALSDGRPVAQADGTFMVGGSSSKPPKASRL